GERIEFLNASQPLQALHGLSQILADLPRAAVGIETQAAKAVVGVLKIAIPHEPLGPRAQFGRRRVLRQRHGQPQEYKSERGEPEQIRTRHFGRGLELREMSGAARMQYRRKE